MAIEKIISYFSDLSCEAAGNVLRIKPPQINGQKLTCAPDSFEITNPLLDFYKKHKDILKKLVTDKDGNFIYKESDKTEFVEITEKEAKQLKQYAKKGDKYYKEVVTQKGEIVRINFDKEYKRFPEDLGVLVHGTSEDAYNSILKTGFRINDKKFAETFHGTYFTRQVDGANRYGERKILAKAKGDVAYGDLDKICYFLHSDAPRLSAYLKSLGRTDISVSQIKEMILRDEFLSRGYVGFYYPEVSMFARCKPVVVFNPNKDLQIISK